MLSSIVSPTSSSLSSSILSSQPAAQPSAPSGNPANTVDNIILSPTLGESFQYGQFCTIKWNATTGGDISAFYKSLLPSPVSLMAPIPSCRNIQNIRGTLMQCPWAAFQSPLPDVTNAGFEIVLMWNGTVEGGQISPEFGVFNASSPMTSTAVLTKASSATDSAAGTTSLLSMTSTAATRPNTITQAQTVMSEKIGLGVDLGVGIPLLVMLIAGCISLYWRRIRKRAGNTTEVSPQNGSLPRPGASRLEKASWNPFMKNLETATLLANYRNAEHFGFVPTPIDR